MLRFGKITEKLHIRRKRGSRRGIPMSSRIFMAFLLFTAAVIAVLWIFYTFFMVKAYKEVRTYETKRCGEVLTLAQSDKLEETADYLAEKFSICISVYKIQDNRGIPVAKVHIGHDCFIHSMVSENYLSSLYSQLSEKGELINTVSGGDVENILYAKLKTVDGAEYMYVFNTELYPMSSTLSTMRLVLLAVSIVLIAISAVLSVLLSTGISRPAVKMSQEAAKLAIGDYSVNFSGDGCLEMENLADTLNRASVELSRLDRMQKDLIANVSHDLRTPLTLISGYSEVMRDIPGEATAENLQVIIDETKRLASLVEDMLDLSRMMSGTQKLNISRFSLTEAVRETVDRYSRLNEREGFTLELFCDGEAYVCADKTRILQVIYNLTNNAINYTGEDKRVVIRQRIERGACRIEVSDSGQGIPEDELPLIWERYYKSREFHKRSKVGTGLGLSIVKNILVLHGAAFGVSSGVGKGSTFWFELPVSEEKE